MDEAEYDRRYRANLNSELRDKAEKHREDWTDADYAMLARTDITMREKATLMGRTFYAIKTKSDKLRKLQKAELEKNAHPQ